MQIYLYMSAPFQTKKSDYVRDMRLPKRRHRDRIGIPCRDRVKLIDALADALFTFEIHVRIYKGGSLLCKIVSELQGAIQGNTMVEPLFRTLALQGRLPATLQGVRAKTVSTHIKMMNTYLQALIQESNNLFPVLPQAYVRECYYQLLSDMKNAFKKYGPENDEPRTKYSNQAIYHAISEILSPLLQISELSLDSGCTIQGAISQRLSQRLPHS